MGVKVKGISRAKSNLNKLINTVQGKKSARAVQAVMMIGSTQAALYTAIDTATLINSQFRELTVNGTKITGRVGYSANYAVYVHDPNIPQTFRRATAQKEFLTKGFDDTRSQRDAAVIKEMSL
ncbi:HK97 gp10 family phage protein [Dryocola clanedunensis]